MADPVAAAHQLRWRIAAAAEVIERERQVPASLIADLFEAGLFSLLVPRSLGGAEVDLLSFARAVEEVARADASVAWCIGQANGLATYMTYGDPSMTRSLFLDQRTILANGPGEDNRPGRAVVTEGGYRVSGRWMFASGIGHATWLLAICHLQDANGTVLLEGDRQPAQRLMVVPKQCATVHDVWHVSGLRGTGSQSFSLDDVFVDSAYAVHVTAAARREDGPLYLFSNNGFFGPAFGSVALGIAETVLVEFVAFAGGKVPRGVAHPIRDNATVQAAVAVCRARLDAARRYLHQVLTDVWSAVAARGSVLVDERVAVRLAATHATQEAAGVVDTAFNLAGSHAIFENGPFARRFRDMHAVTQQLQARRQHYEHVGRYLLGLDPDLSFL